jgi:leucyl-tRNA synthetase
MEFEYWYPMDLRVSGKDLVQNHLTFSLYNHCAIFPKKFWPLAMRANGHIELDDQKMSKSTGNFLTMYDAVEQFSADGTRFTLAESGDGINDANFKTDTASKRVTQLHTELEWIKEAVDQVKQGKLRQGELDSWHDKVFSAEIEYAIQTAIKHYDATFYRLAVNSSWHGLIAARDDYRRIMGDNMHKDLIFKFCETLALLNCPVIPHFCERVWQMIGKSGFVVAQRFPVPNAYDPILIQAKTHLFDLIHAIRKSNIKQGKQGKQNLRIYVAKKFPPYVVRAMEIISSQFDVQGKKLKTEKGKILQMIYEDSTSQNFLKELQKLAPFILTNLEKTGDVSSLQCAITFDEMELFQQRSSVIKQELSLSNVEIVAVEDPETMKLTPPCNKIQSVRPYFPQYILY